MAGPTWTATKGGLIGGGLGLLGGAGIGYAISGKPAQAPKAAGPVRKHALAHENPATMVATSLGGLIGTALGGLVGAMLGKRSQFNQWSAASQACPGNQVADWATFACTNLCPDDSIPVNGQCQGYVPKSGLLGAPHAGVGACVPRTVCGEDPENNRSVCYTVYVCDPDSKIAPRTFAGPPAGTYVRRVFTMPWENGTSQMDSLKRVIGIGSVGLSGENCRYICTEDPDLQMSYCQEVCTSGGGPQGRVAPRTMGLPQLTPQRGTPQAQYPGWNPRWTPGWNPRWTPPQVTAVSTTPGGAWGRVVSR